MLQIEGRYGMSQKSTAKFIYNLTMRRSRRMIKAEYGEAFWHDFQEKSDRKFTGLMKDYPDIGNSMFAFNYAYAPGYVAWYTSMEALGLDAHQCDLLMLKMNEKMLLTVPKGLLHAVGKAYYKNMSRTAKKRTANPPSQIHPFDWEIDYREVDADRFEIDIKKCGFITYAEKYGGTHMLPGICQVDYMISHYMNVGFDRNQTLGAGGNKCDCKYCLTGSCSWNMEQRLRERK